MDVGLGDVDGDGFSEILTGPGPGSVFGPQVRGFNYDGVQIGAMAKLNFEAFQPLAYGANAAGGEIDLDAYDELVVGQGPGPTFSPNCVGYGFDASTILAIPGFDATLSGAERYGAHGSLGDVASDGAEELVAGTGPDPSAPAIVRPYLYFGGGLTPLFSVDTMLGPYGVDPAASDLGY